MDACSHVEALHREVDETVFELTLDAKTRLPNLFSFFQHFIALTPPASGVLLAFDIAGLKAINTAQGREAGDDCIAALRLAALEAVTAWPHQGARLFRSGGDEFLLLLPEATDTQAARMQQQIRAAYIQCAGTAAHGGTRLHSALVAYPRDAQTAGGLLAHCYQQIHHSRSGQPPAAMEALPRWMLDAVDELIDRVNDTVALAQDIQNMALTDEVSSLPNHRAATWQLDQQLQKYKLTSEPFSILFIDGDNLKVHNERFGYEAGHALIRRLASTLRAHLRGGDFLSRWLVGDEFLAVLPGADAEAAADIADRLVEAVVSSSSSWRMPTSVSIGFATCPEDAAEVDSLLRIAELANSAAKRAGKACVRGRTG